MASSRGIVLFSFIIIIALEKLIMEIRTRGLSGDENNQIFKWN